jgi:hypothetical protein
VEVVDRVKGDERTSHPQQVGPKIQTPLVLSFLVYKLEIRHELPVP